jgi:head-tail adaptor
MFSSSELANMRSAQTGHMLDTCLIQTYGRTINSFGEPAETWTDAVGTTACGLDMRPGSETWGADKTVVTYDATLRMPIPTTIDVKDRVKVTKRFDEAITAQVYEIYGPIQRGPSGIRLLLKRIET